MVIIIVYNYRSGIHVRFPCTRNELNYIFISMFGRPMQCRLKLKSEIEINQFGA